MTRRSSRRPTRNPETGTRENPVVIESISDVDAFLGSPGHYQTTSTFPAYPVVKALDGWHPLFKGGMTMPFVEGDVFFFQVLETPEREALPGVVPEGEILSDTSLRRNALVAMGVSPDFWSKLLQRYRNWELAWWREVAQNSRDAQATRMEFSVTPGTYRDVETGDSVEAMVVVAYDNGVGMDADILRRALLTRGGSVKPESAVGGFGDAKNLILFPWYGWKVETRDLVAVGQHESVLEPPGVHQVPSGIQGTRITTWMPLTQTTSETYALQLLGRSHLPGVTVRVNGKTIPADLIGGEEVSTAQIKDEDGKIVGEIVAHHQRNARANKGLYVRARGVFMFEEYAPNIPGVVYVDVNAPAKYVFDASRNSLIGPARQFVEKLKASLAKEPESVLRSKKWKAEKIYRGTGEIEVREGRAAEVAAKAVAKIAGQITKKKTSKADVDSLSKYIEIAFEEDEARAPEPVTLEEQTAQRIQSSRETVVSLVQNFLGHATSTEQVAAAVRFAMWQPDLYVANQMPFWKMPKGLEPETMEQKYVVLLRAWTEACKFGLNALGDFRPFGVGFVMLLDGMNQQPALGAYTRKEDTDWLMINPVKFKRGRYDYDAGEYEWTLEGDRLDMSLDSDIEELCSTAIHEITHMQGFKDHDQGYASQLTVNMKAAHRGMATFMQKQVKTIRSETRARFAEIKKEKTAAKKKPEATPWKVIVGRVAVLLGWWDSFRQLHRKTLDVAPSVIVQSAKNYKDELKEQAQKALYVMSIELDPKVIMQLYDEANKAGLFDEVDDKQAVSLVSQVEEMPADPRPRAETKGAPTGPQLNLFTWVGEALHAGFGEGDFVGVQDGSAWAKREITSALINTYFKKKRDSEGGNHETRPIPLGENTYVWYPASVKNSLFLPLQDTKSLKGLEWSNDDSSAQVYILPSYDEYIVDWPAGIDADSQQQHYSSVSEAQIAAMDKIAELRKGHWRK